MTNVRYREDVGWEMRCEDCKTKDGTGGFYWPLLPYGEFWGKCLSRCVACERARIRRHRRRTKGRSPDPVSAADSRRNAAAKARIRYYRNREVILARHRAKYAADSDRILAERRRRYHARKDAA